MKVLCFQHQMCSYRQDLYAILGNMTDKNGQTDGSFFSLYREHCMEIADTLLRHYTISISNHTHLSAILAVTSTSIP